MMPYKPGEILLDKYRIEELIGQGAFAEVYRVTHVKLNVTRAVKILSRETPGVGSTEFKEFLARFQLEAQLGAMINTPAPHPNLLQVHDFQQKGELLLLEMEYAAGGNLADRIARVRERGELIPIEEAVQIATDIAEGLAAIHAGDIVHRDLKPSNILFDREGGAKVADLGLAQIPGGPSMRSRISQPLPHPGTPGYMSPEQKDERDYLKPCSDVYALGLILFEMLTGRFYRNVRPDTRVSDLRADVPAWLDLLVADMLRIDASKRPWDGAEVVQLLDSQGQVDQRQPQPIKTKETQKSKRKGVPTWGLVLGGISFVVIALAIAIPLGIWLLNRDSSSVTPEPDVTQALAVATQTTQVQVDDSTDTQEAAIADETETALLPTPTTRPTQTQAAASCPNALPYRLQSGDQAQVEIFQLSARSAPGFDAHQDHVLARDRVVEILEGPVCADNAWWWKIHYAGTISSGKYLEYDAWMLEADHDTYYLSAYR